MSSSTDGINFVRVRSITVVMLPKILVGIVFSSHNTSVSGKSLFEEPYNVQ